jgi:hypothetical protein
MIEFKSIIDRLENEVSRPLEKKYQSLTEDYLYILSKHESDQLEKKCIKSFYKMGKKTKKFKKGKVYKGSGETLVLCTEDNEGDFQGINLHSGIECMWDGSKFKKFKGKTKDLKIFKKLLK